MTGAANVAASLRIVAADAVAAEPWKNGGGVTRELLGLVLPGSAPRAGWDLRISVADIDADGPFSAFDGISRWFAVLEGAGVRLHWPGGATGAAASADAAGAAGMHAGAARTLDVRPGDPPLQFDGEDAPDCRLLRGPTRDLNVMVRHAVARAALLPALPARPWSWAGCGRGLFALQALTLLREGEPPLSLAPCTLAWTSEGDTRPWSIARALPAPPSMSQTDGSSTPATLPVAPPGYWIGLAG
jgi:environmental stress-induced protein Ves